MFKNTAIRINIYKSPFILITSFTVIGILLVDYVDFKYSILLFILSIILLLIDLKYSLKKWITVFLFILLFTSLGYQLSSDKSHKNTHELFKSTKSKSYYILKICHLYKSTSNWKRVEVEVLQADNNKIVKLLLIAKDFSFEKGDVLGIYLNVSPIKNKGNPGEFDSEQYYKSKDIQAIAFHDDSSNIDVLLDVDTLKNITFFERLRIYFSHIIDNNLNIQDASLAKALLIGDKSSLEKTIKQDFSNTGAMHVLAVSGLHIGIILSILLFILQLFSKWISKQKAFLIAVILLWFYAFITGLSPSILRATFLFTILAYSKSFSKNNNSINSLFFSAFILLLVNPLYIYDIGFQLSYAAMLGIFLFYTPIYNIFSLKNRYIDLLWKGTALGISAQLFTFPLTTFYFHQFPNYFMLTNLGLIVITGFILGIGVFSLLFNNVWYLNKLLFYIFSLSLFLLLKIISSISSLPYAVAFGFNFSYLEVLFLYFSLFILYTYHKNRKYQFVIVLSFLSIISYIEYQRFSNLSKDEICFFNSPKPIFIIKNGNQAICFYNDDLDKAQFLINSYIKLKPCHVIYKRIDNENYKIRNQDIVLDIDSQKNFTLIHLNGEKYSLQYGEINRIHKFNEYKVISIKNSFVQNNRSYCLENGAIIYEIKKSDHIDRI